MKAWDVVFDAGEEISLSKAGCELLRIGYAEGCVTAALLCAHHAEPLRLSAPAAAGTQAIFRLREARAELLCGGRVLDEDWPWGTPDLFGAEICGSAELLPAPGEEMPPAVTGCFRQAEGWRPEGHGEVFVGDCMPYADGGRYHVLWLWDRRHHRSKWGRGAHQWAHISTDDLENWQIHPMAVPITEDWEGSICTGSHIRRGDTEYLFYTVRTMDGSPAPLRRSLSRDGYHFEKDGAFSVTLSSRYHGASARDPKVVRDAEGRYHMFVTTSLIPEDRGCLAHLISEDLDSWREIDPVYIAPEGEDQPECSDYFVAGGWYYLVLSHHGRGQYFYSREPFGGWQRAADNTIPCRSVPKMAFFGERIIFTGFAGEDGKYAGTMTFTEAFPREDGSLSFKPLFETFESERK
ncbi:MAG: hypothetical protein IKL89_07910 [Clostridia bacterium]|nr:hypothetical protein [Clostridia bacterium]